MYFYDDPKSGERYGITTSAVEWSLAFALAHVLLEFIFFWFESAVTETSILHYFVVCYNAR